MDPRLSSPRIKTDLFKGLVVSHQPLFDEGITPIPSINWLIKNTEVKSAIMITGSHIAPELNGLKFYAHNEEVPEDDQKEIESIYYSLKEKVGSDGNPNPIIETRARDLYKQMLLSLATKNQKPLNIAVDCANGSQSVVMPDILKNLGHSVSEINCSTSTGFIARDTDTDDKAGLEELKKFVVEQGCDLGIAFDGDGDRVVFIDEKGHFIQGEYSCSLIARESPSDTIVTTISASQVVDSLGKKVVRTKVGSPHIVKAMKESGADFGFEPNGGAVSGEIMMTRDGGSMCIKMLNLINKLKKPFSEIVASLPKYYMFRTKVDYPWELKEQIINKAKKDFVGIKTEDLDGLKIWIDDKSWILFRSSANAPEFRVFAESIESQKAQDLLKRGLDLVNSVIRHV
jgi:phosphomannomutase/phosphoglucomutase